MIGKVRMKRVILICILILAAICLVGISKAYGATVTGTVNSEIGVNFRSEPDASKDNIIGAIPYGEKVEILGTAQGGGYSWYKISYNGKTGYAVSDFITKDASAGHEEGDFTNTYGIVNSDIGVNVRSGPGTEYERIDGLFDGTQVKVNGQAKDSNGDIWYEVVCSAGKGYISGEYLILKEIKPYEPNADFEAHLTKQGFPESYKVLLRQLHAQYPNWIFVAGKTNLDWNYVITKEYGYAGYRPNTIQNGQPDSWKTMEDGDYNFSTGQYRSYDSGYYVAASKSLIEYYMDPRNFLNATDIFQFISSKYEPALQNSTGLQAMINGTFMSGRFPESTYSTYNAVLMDAASKSGASPYTLATMILQEQGYDGSGHSISGTEPGYVGIYNYFNIGAYASGGVSAVENGLIYARNQGWNTRAKSILGGANWFARNYVNANKYTQYLKKFNVMNGAGQVATGQYMTHVMGSYLEGRNLRSAYAGFLGTSLTFEIPVYTNMPESACPMPGRYGNNNNFLDSISVSGKTLSPAFNRFTYTYTVDAGNASKITLSAKANNSAAKVEGLGTKTLKTGTNTFNITVTATSGEKRVYTVNVKTTGSGTTDFEFTSGTIELEQGDVSGHLVKTTDKTSKLTLTSSNKNVAEITKINSNDSRGYYFEITAKAVGETVITAELGGVKKSFTVKVKGKDFGFTSGTVELEQGDVSGHLVKTTDKTNKLTLISSNRNVAEITKINSNDSRGYYFEITAKAVGESVITAELGGVKKSFTVKVISVNDTMPAYRLLKKGMRGEDVKYFQKILKDNGYLDSSFENGVYDERTKNAVVLFQLYNGLKSPDGMIGNWTRTVIKKGVKPFAINISDKTDVNYLMQNEMKEKGYLMVTPDGLLGSNTRKGLKALNFVKYGNTDEEINITALLDVLDEDCARINNLSGYYTIGSNCTDIARIKARMSLFGFDTLSNGTIFDIDFQRALSVYQTLGGINSDGIFGAWSARNLNAGTIYNQIVTYGTKGNATMGVQLLLKSVCELKVSPDGIFGGNTYNALRTFQSKFGLSVTGKGDYATLIKLNEVKNESKNIDYVVDFKSTIGKGDIGADVLILQRRLNLRGYLMNTPDGIFGINTYNALIEFQRDNGIYPDGICGAKTILFLNKH